MSELLLSGRGLNKSYGGVIAVKDVSIEVHAGEVLGLVGPNGAGKTTLVDLITGAQVANSGELRLRDEKLAGPASRRARMGLARTFQHPQLPPDLRIIEVLATGVTAKRLGSLPAIVARLFTSMITGPDGDYDTAAAVGTELGITDLDRMCGDLTLGEQRLVEVGRALAQEPIVMLLDEPFAGADPTGIAGIVDAIRQVQERGFGVILVDHNVDLLAGLVDRVMLMDRGAVVFDGDPEECLASDTMKQVYFGTAD
ncbi:ABC transporter ATP-binding protein [Enemella sp. A6]|uniref:ABC transporter ATP-binding protein n=1 Tax=Enemella sp. A6 TaxID=3440152 RepID=UPI003EB80D77